MFLTIPLGCCTAALLALLWWQTSVAQRRLRQMTTILLGALIQANQLAEAQTAITRLVDRLYAAGVSREEVQQEIANAAVTQIRSDC